jgi:hypothetical protein
MIGSTTLPEIELPDEVEALSAMVLAMAEKALSG